MTFEQAWQRVALAGRELGSGPAISARRILEDNGDSAFDWMIEHGIYWENAGPIALGAAIGLVMAEDETALKTLKDINKEWLENHGR